MVIGKSPDATVASCITLENMSKTKHLSASHFQVGLEVCHMGCTGSNLLVYPLQAFAIWSTLLSISATCIHLPTLE